MSKKRQKHRYKKTKAGKTPRALSFKGQMQEAVKSKNWELVKEHLINHHDIFNKYDDLPLVEAVHSNRLDIVEVIKDKYGLIGLDLNKALQKSITQGSEEIFNILIEAEGSLINPWDIIESSKNGHDKFSAKVFEIFLNQKTDTKSEQEKIASKLKQTADDAQRLVQIFNNEVKDRQSVNIKTLLQKNANNLSILDLMIAMNSLDTITKPELWVGKQKQFKKLCSHIPKNIRKGLDLNHTISQINRLTIQKTSKRPSR